MLVGGNSAVFLIKDKKSLLFDIPPKISLTEGRISIRRTDQLLPILESFLHGAGKKEEPEIPGARARRLVAHSSDGFMLQ